MFAVSENRAIFVVANNVKTTESYCYIFSRNHKAGSPTDNSTSVVLRCLPKHHGGPASFVYNRNFFPTMANNEKVSGTGNNSTRTAPIAPYSTLKSEERQSQHLYKVKFYGVGQWNKSSFDIKADIHYTDNYTAVSAFEATGMAIAAVQKEYPQYDIVLRSIKCSLLNPLA